MGRYAGRVSCALVVDDSVVQALGIAATLTRAGYAPVYSAVDWAECRRALARDVAQLIILDVTLPGMVSGDVMAMQLRRNPRCLGARLVLYSGLKERDLAALAQRCGADAFLSKGPEHELVALCKRLVPP